jgi:hypothetical protein
MIYTIAACLWGGAKVEIGADCPVVRYITGSMRSSAAILVRVQFHIMAPSPQSVIRCWKVSVFPHWLQSSVYERWIAASRSLIGTMSWITVYHRYFRRSGIQAVCSVVHTRVQGIVGCFWVTRSS